jgi:iron complex transport system permease protein
MKPSVLPRLFIPENNMTKSDYPNTRKHLSSHVSFLILTTLLLTLLLVSSVFAVTLGTVKLPLDHSFAVLINKLFGIMPHNINISTATKNIIWEIRMPRVIMGILVGGGLSLCGCVMQAVVKNPLADPYILGISSGAAFGATFAIMIGALFGGIIGQMGVGLFAFMGAVGAATAVMALASIGGSMTSVKLILAGTIINSLCTAFSNFIIYSAGTAEGIRTVTFWLMGSLTAANWKQLPLLAISVLINTILFFTQARPLNIMLLGDETAATLGYNPVNRRRLYMTGVSFLTGVIVANCGMIGFLGLIVPHIVRGLIGSDHRRLIPLTVIAGSLFMVLADVIARSIIPQGELPIGIVTAMAGAPLFAFILVKKRYGFGGN